ncbi:MAG: RDD family protein [Candidatus Roizmanbacteria bacterium]
MSINSSSLNPVSSPDSTPHPLVFASFKRRLVAMFVDALVVLIIGYVLRLSLGIEITSKIFSAKTLEQLMVLTNSSTAMYGNIVTVILSFLYFSIFYIYFEGATPGKKLLGMKVVRADGKPLTFATVLVRYLFSFVSSFCLSLGYIWAIFDSKKQTWHDKVSNTYVVLSGAPAHKGLGIVLSILFILIYSTSIFLIFTYVGALIIKSAPKEQVPYVQKELSPEVKKVSESANSQFAIIKETQDAVSRKKIVNGLISELKDAVVKYPKESDLWNSLASAYTWSEDSNSLNDAATAVNKSIAIDPKNAMSYQTLGQIYLNQNKYSEAVIEFKKSLRLNDNNGYSHLRLADAYRLLNISDDARAEYKKGIEIFEKANEKGDFDSEILDAKKSMSSLK